jgi:hypothetical protein
VAGERPARKIRRPPPAADRAIDKVTLSFGHLRSDPGLLSGVELHVGDTDVGNSLRELGFLGIEHADVA